MPVKKIAKKRPSSSAKKAPARRTAAKKAPVKKAAARKAPAAAAKKGKSFSQVAREILEKTGSRAKATAKLKEIGCSSAAAVVSKVAGPMGIAPEGRSAGVAKKKAKTKTKAVAGRKKIGKVKPKKKDFEEDLEEDFEDEEYDEEEDEDDLDEDFEDEDF